MRTYLILSDLHVPFHCPKYLKIAKKIIKTHKLAGLVQLGDALDLWQISTYDKDPSRRNNVADDINDWAVILTDLCKDLPRGAEVHLLEGNHSARLQRYIARNARELHGIVPSIPVMLALKARETASGLRFFWHPYSKWNSCRIGDCVLLHGFYYNQHVAMTNLVKYRTSIICGHTHRVQYVTDGVHYSCSLGHGSDEAVTAHQPTPTGWQQAMGLLNVDDEGKTHLEVILVKDGKAVVRGKTVKA